MTEEDRLQQLPGCGWVIVLGLIIIVILSLVGLIFPLDLLPYPNEMLIGIIIISTIALVIVFFVWRSKKREQREEANERADALLRQGFETLQDKHDEAARLAVKYYSDDEPKGK